MSNKGKLQNEQKYFLQFIETKYMRTDDGFLISKCLGGDSVAFGILVDKYKAGIYALVYSRLHNFQDAEDIAQETFVEAYKRLSTLRRWEKFSSWLYSIANNLCKNFIRSKSNRPDREYTEDQKPLLTESQSLESYHAEQLISAIHDSLSTLPEIYQSVLLLHYLGGLSSDEIANVIGISPANARQRLSRGRSLLKSEILESAVSEFKSKKLQAGFTFQIVEAVKHIKVAPKSFAFPLAMSLSLVTTMTIMIFGFFIPIDLTQPIDHRSGLSLSKKRMIPKKLEHQIPILILNSQKSNRLVLFESFDNEDVSNWTSGYYEGTVDQNGKQKGKPIIKVSPNSAKSGKYGLLFIKNKEYGSSCVASSPEFGPLTKKFQLDFDIILLID